MTVSVLIPNYNHASFIGQAIDSVMAQTRQPDEVIILDDCSTDDSLQVIRSYQQRYSIIKLLSNEENKGAMQTARKLQHLASGDYIAGLSADDWFLPEYLERALQLAALYPQAGIIMGKIMVVDENGRTIDVVGVDMWQIEQFIQPDRLLAEYLDVVPPNHSLCGATIFRRDAFAEVDFFRPELGPWADTFAARAIALKYGACYIPEPVMCWRYLEDSLSNKAARTPEKYIEIVDKASALMRSDQFRDRFPEEHVADWSKRYKDFLFDLHAGKASALFQAKQQMNRLVSSSSTP